MVLKSVIKTDVFRKVKFYDPTRHAVFSHDTHILCGMIVEKCHIKPDHAMAWWSQVQPSIRQHITDQRNNVIKSIERHFKGKPYMHPLITCMSLTIVIVIVVVVCIIQVGYRYARITMSMIELKTAMSPGYTSIMVITLSTC